MKILSRYIIILILTVSASTSSGQTADSTSVKWSGFLDTYFMYDFNDLPNNAASHPFTQPLRHNEFNINLAQIEARINSEHIHGAISLQTGTSVKANYAAESNNRELSELIHEAWAGYQVAKNIWVDAGIYPSPYGFEGWISKDNKTYTRSLVADFSPYYQTGIRASWQVSEAVSVVLNIVNGWQNISETNTDKAIGITLGYTPSSTISFTYNNFIGNEMPAGTPAAVRFFNDLCTRLSVTNDLQFDLVTDYGRQRKDSTDASWLGLALIGRYELSNIVAIAARGEYYKDEHQVILVTGSVNGFDGFGLSGNVDIQASSILLWRTELRMLKNKTTIFKSNDGLSNTSSFIVSSLALSF